MLIDPRNLNSIPSEFLEEFLKNNPIYEDPEELAHFREVVASFLNYSEDKL